MAQTPLVIVITGPPGVGKTTTAWELCEILEQAGLTHAMIDTDNISWFFRVGGDRYNRGLLVENMQAVWRNYARAGATRLVIAGVLESQEELDMWRGAVSADGARVFRLTADQDELRRRITLRDGDLSVHDRTTQRALAVAASLEPAPYDAVTIDTTRRSKIDVARSIFEKSGWQPNP